MSKATTKTNTTSATPTPATTSATVRMSFKDVRIAYPGISLKRLCETAGLCYQYVLKAGKQPIAGEAYDATSFNYEAVQRICDKHTDLDLSTFDWASIEAEALQAKSAQPRVSAVTDFHPGTLFTLRNPKEVTFSTIYVTSTHIVFIAVPATPATEATTSTEDNSMYTQPRVMSWDTFTHQSPRICGHN